jgi:MFS family permease
MLHMHPVTVAIWNMTGNSSLTWRWCFYINLPIGVSVVVALVLFLQLDEKPRERVSTLEQFKRLDPLGLLFFIPSMVCLILALQWGGSTYSWSAPKMIGLLVAFAVTLVIFVVVQVLMPKTAMIPMRVILDRSIAGAMLFTFLLAGGMMIGVYYLVIWFQLVQFQSAIDSGIHLLPMVLALIFFGFIAAAITQKIGYYVPAMLLSPLFAAVGMGMLSTLTPSSGAGAWIGYQIVYGIGIGIGSQSANLVSQATLPRSDMPIGMAMQFFMQQLGGAVFLSVAQNVFATELVESLSGVVGLDAHSIVNTGTVNLRTAVPASEIDTVINACSNSITRTFLIGAILSACMIVGSLSVKWRSIKTEKGSVKEVKEHKGQNGEESEQV